MNKLLTQEEVIRYSRHLLIPQVGLSGQVKIKNASVLVVGAGGLGSPISLYLAAAGVGRIGLVDFDVVDETNLQRQVIHSTSKVGIPKVESAKVFLEDLNPLIEIIPYNEMITSNNIERIAENYQIIVDGSDNFSTRYLLNDYCVFTKKPYVYGSIFRFEGQISVFNSQHGPCYRCIFPSPPPPGIVPSCGEGGVFGVLPGTVGTMQATEVIKLILGIGENSTGKLFLYDAFDLTMQSIKLKKNPNCKVCGENPEIVTLEDTAFFCDTHLPAESFEKDWGWSVQEFKKALDQGKRIRVIDVRDPIEREIVSLPDSEIIPYEQINPDIVRDEDVPVIFYCRNGIRSGRATQKLRNAGFKNIFNLVGGTNAWVREIDKESFLY